ncbi:MAG: hypothetical protein WBZ04_07440 [Candidatus Nanopelagicales bacterium]
MSSQASAHAQAIGRSAATLRALENLLSSQRKELSSLAASVNHVTANTATSADKKLLTHLTMAIALIDTNRSRIQRVVQETEQIGRQI